MRFSLDSLLGIHAQSLTLRSQRATVLANNIVNADTPNFKARDMDFKEVLSRISSGDDSVTLRSTEPNHISERSESVHGNLKYRVPLQPSLDGNTVDSQKEISSFTENALRYQASLKFLSNRVQGIVSALKGE